jgi:hypothetical protein
VSGVIAYHGTGLEQWRQIQRHGFLEPRTSSDELRLRDEAMRRWGVMGAMRVAGLTTPRIYFALDVTIAAMYAAKRPRGRTRMALEWETVEDVERSERDGVVLACTFLGPLAAVEGSPKEATYPRALATSSLRVVAEIAAGTSFVDALDEQYPGPAREADRQRARRLGDPQRSAPGPRRRASRLGL